jgi:hypothetical protein
VGIFGRRRQIIGWDDSVGGLLGLVEQPLQEGPAPTATGASAVTLGQLTDTARAFDANEVLDFPPTHMEAKAEFVVEFHGQLLVPTLCVVTFLSPLCGNLIPLA